MFVESNQLMTDMNYVKLMDWLLLALSSLRYQLPQKAMKNNSRIEGS